jgi:hypothetical protein
MRRVGMRVQMLLLLLLLLRGWVRLRLGRRINVHARLLRMRRLHRLRRVRLERVNRVAVM